MWGVAHSTFGSHLQHSHLHQQCQVAGVPIYPWRLGSAPRGLAKRDGALTPASRQPSRKATAFTCRTDSQICRHRCHGSSSAARCCSLCGAAVTSRSQPDRWRRLRPNARRKRDISDEDDHLDDEDEEEAGSDADDEEEDFDDMADGRADPTTKLFSMVQQYSGDEDDGVDDEEEDEDDTLTLEPTAVRNKPKRVGTRKVAYDANAEVKIPGIDEEEDENIIEDAPLDDDDPFADEGLLDAELDGGAGDEIDLDAIMQGNFEDEEAMPAVAAEMPAGVAERKPTVDTGYVEMPDMDEEEPTEDLEEEEEASAIQYPEPPERRYLLGDLLEMCSYGFPDTGASNVEVQGIQNRVYDVREGDLYVCVEEDGYDGYEHVEAAAQAGASAIISEREIETTVPVPVIVVPDSKEALTRLAVSFYNNPSRKMTVVGITGSRGKTTTAWLIRGIFEEMQKVTGMISTIEYAIAVDKMMPDGSLWMPEEDDVTLDRECSTPFYLAPYKGKYEEVPSTPDNLAVQKVMAGMADRGATTCVYEVTTHALANKWASAVDTDVAVYMGLLQEEIDERGADECINLQGQLFTRLQDPVRQRAVINLDDPYAETIQECARNVPVVTFSANSSSADVYVEKVAYSVWETELIIKTPVGQLPLNSTLIGRHNVYNILAAVAVGLAITLDGEPVPLKDIVQGIEATEIIPGRCEIVDEDQDFGVVIDSANTPETLSRLLDSIREAGAKRIILVFGCEGERDASIRPFMGEIAHYKANVVILTNNNPRGEDPPQILADIIAGYPDKILEHNARVPYQPGFLQDPGRLPFEALEFAWQNCYEYQRYVQEDRWTAIRWAIGTAQKGDCVVIAGKGHEDYQEWDIGTGHLIRGWFDDRVECRNALSKVASLARPDVRKEMDRIELPWMEPDERLENQRIYNVEGDI